MHRRGPEALAGTAFPAPGIYIATAEHLKLNEKGITMAEHAAAIPASTSDPFHGASASVQGAIESVRQNASELIPAAGGFISRMVYTSSYVVAYGFVFPVMLVVRVIPKDNAFVHGIVDGAQAASGRVSGSGASVAHWEDESQEHEANGEESGEHDGEPKLSTAKSHGRRGARHRGARRGSH